MRALRECAARSGDDQWFATIWHPIGFEIKTGLTAAPFHIYTSKFNVMIMIVTILVKKKAPIYFGALKKSILY